MVFIAVSGMNFVEQDISIYFSYGGKVLEGLIPYRDFNLEYPPGALLFFVLPRILADDLLSYRQLFMAEMMLVDLGTLYLITVYMQKRRFSARFQYICSLFYVAVPALIGLIAFQRFDLVPAMLTLAAVIAYEGRSRWAAWFLLGLGIAVKLYPVVLAPVFLIYAYKRKNLVKELTHGLPAALAAIALAWLPLWFLSGQKFWIFLSYHSQRGIQIESIYSTILLLSHHLGYPVTTLFSFGSTNVEAAVSPFFAKTSLAVMGCLVAAVLVRALAADRESEPGSLPRTAVLVVLGFVIGGKVLSPQYLLWIVPLLIISLEEIGPETKKIGVLFALLTLLTFLIFPVNYKGLINLQLWPVLLLALRNIMLILVFYLLLKKGRVSRQKMKISDP